MALDDDAREFLLYVIITSHWKRGGELVIPDFIARKELSAEDYRKYGTELAGRRAVKFGAGVNMGPYKAAAGGIKSRGMKKARQEEELMDVEVQQGKVSHLSEFCHSSTQTFRGCQVKRVLPVGETKPMTKAGDARHLTPVQRGGQYLELCIAGKRVYGLYDTGSNCTIVSKKLADGLKLPQTSYGASFRQASGSMAKFVGKVGNVNL